jgi:outer membrane protein assembly factor BamB
MKPFEPPKSAEPMLAKVPKSPRLWPGAVLVAMFWCVFLGSGWLDAPISTGFMSIMAASALLTLLFPIWWLTNGRVSGVERVYGFLSMVALAAIAVVFCDPSVGVIGLVFLGFPTAFTAWIAWLLVARRASPEFQRYGTIVVLALVWAAFIVVRIDGVDGNNSAALSLRWRPSAEDRYLAERAKTTPASTSEPDETAPLVPQDGDWLDFRGPDRRGEVHGIQIATDWDASPPKQLWRRRIGPAWSSVLIIDGRLITQEQRGDSEAVVCLDAKTGRELWAHEDRVRYSDGQAGAGPRATPTFSDGQIYSLGATGVLNCLDARSGKVTWSRDIVVDSKAPLPMWGFSSSPLVAQGRVVVYGGAQPDKGLLAYAADSGEPEWTAATGAISYSSAQLVSFADEPQLLFFSDAGLIAVQPTSGKLLWQYEAPQNGIWRVVQPRQLDDGAILIGCEDLGLVRLDVTQKDSQWTATPRWKSRAIRPAFNDFAISGDCVYGFDEGIFCCVDAETGKRRWKAGRYGHGQVLLIADQRLLLVVTETGEVVLVAANPEKHEELGRMQAVTGKTWNHPVIAHGALYIRNDQEMACFELRLAETALSGL